MQFATLALFAASASAAAVLPRQVAPEMISNFKAACTPHSSTCEYSFGVTNDPSIGAPNECAATVSGFETLPAVVADKACKVANTDVINYAYTWSIEPKPDGGLSFEFWWPLDSRTNLTYCHDIPAADLVIDTDGAVKTQRYVGPTDFEMPFCAGKQH